MKKEDVKLHDLVAVSDPLQIKDEIRHLVALMVDDFDYRALEQALDDTVLLFQGEYPGYRASNTKYHDLEHTNMVAMTTARLLHGLHVDGRPAAPRHILLGIVASLFHDTGLIQQEHDSSGSGAKYTIGHEQRSVSFMENYFRRHGYSAEDVEDCSQIIMCTIINKPTSEIPFRTSQTELAGKVLGTADLLAQMADRLYLEKLPLLFKEFEEGGIMGYESELDLLKKTETFYRAVAKKRLAEEMDNVDRVMRSHFRERWGIDRDLYADAIASNINHLQTLHHKCKDQFECYLGNLRRGGIIEKHFKTN